MASHNRLVLKRGIFFWLTISNFLYIIVLLILAGVSITMLTGDNGLLTKAGKARTNTEHATVREAIIIAYTDYQVEQKTANTTKLASTNIKIAEADVEGNQEQSERTFLDYLASEGRNYINNTTDGIVQVENLVGHKLSMGNGEVRGEGERKDVYVVTINEEYNEYELIYYSNEWGSGSISLWETPLDPKIKINVSKTPETKPARSVRLKVTSVEGLGVNLRNDEDYERFEKQIYSMPENNKLELTKKLEVMRINDLEEEDFTEFNEEFLQYLYDIERISSPTEEAFFEYVIDTSETIEEHILCRIDYLFWNDDTEELEEIAVYKIINHDEIVSDTYRARANGTYTFTVIDLITGKKYKKSVEVTNIDTSIEEDILVDIIADGIGLTRGGVVVTLEPDSESDDWTWSRVDIGDELDYIKGAKKWNTNEESKYLIDNNGDLYAWGRNDYGELGVGDEDGIQIPTKVEGISNVEDVYIGVYGYSVIAKTTEGDLYAWGDNEDGQLGVGDKGIRPIPTKIEGISNVEDVYIGVYGYSVIAKTIEGDLYAWGRNDYGELGVGEDQNKTIPTKIAEISNVEEVYINGDSVIAKTVEGDLYAWGCNYSGRLGVGDTDDRMEPTPIAEISNVEDIYIGEYGASVIAKTIGGDLYAWGDNEDGQLGVGDADNIMKPTPIVGIKNVEEVYTNRIVKTKEGDLYALGKNSAKIEEISNVEKVYTNGYSVIAKTTGGNLYAWGSNDSGQLGVGDTDDRMEPTPIAEIRNVEEVYTNGYSVIAKTKEGDLYAWGSNYDGVLGIGDTAIILKPTLIEGISNAKGLYNAFHAGEFHYIITDTGECYRVSGGVEEE